MRTIIYATKEDSCHTLQRLIDDAVIAKYRRETHQPTSLGKTLLSGANIQLIHEADHVE